MLEEIGIFYLPGERIKSVITGTFEYGIGMETSCLEGHLIATDIRLICVSNTTSGHRNEIYQYVDLQTIDRQQFIFSNGKVMRMGTLTDGDMAHFIEVLDFFHLYWRVEAAKDKHIH